MLGWHLIDLIDSQSSNVRIQRLNLPAFSSLNDMKIDLEAHVIAYEPVDLPVCGSSACESPTCESACRSPVCEPVCESACGSPAFKSPTCGSLAYGSHQIEPAIRVHLQSRLSRYMSCDLFLEHKLLRSWIWDDNLWNRRNRLGIAERYRRRGEWQSLLQSLLQRLQLGSQLVVTGHLVILDYLMDSNGLRQPYGRPPIFLIESFRRRFLMARVICSLKCKFQ